jgi:hypothetical protein
MEVKMSNYQKDKSEFLDKLFHEFSKNSYSICAYAIKKKIDGRIVYVPCGKCYYCRSKKTSEWINRINRELFLIDGSKRYSHVFFITLTYNNESLQQRLNKGSIEDFLAKNKIIIDEIEKQKFINDEIIRRFKKDVKNYLSKIRMFFRRRGCGSFRYYVAFEYGSLNDREHMHLLLFVKNNLDRKLLLELKDKVKSYWKNGYVDFKKVADFSGIAQYVSKYIMKGNIKCELGLISKAGTFSLKSKRMGWDSYLDILENKEYDKIKSVPKSFYNWLKKNRSDLFNNFVNDVAIQNKRRLFEFVLDGISIDSIFERFRDDVSKSGIFLEVAFGNFVIRYNDSLRKRRQEYILNLIEKGKIKR